MLGHMTGQLTLEQSGHMTGPLTLQLTEHSRPDGYIGTQQLVLKIYKGQAISKRDSLHSSINKHLDMTSPTITETVQIVKKRTENKKKPIKALV